MIPRPQPSCGEVDWFSQRAADRPLLRKRIRQGASACLAVAAEVLAGGAGLGRGRDTRAAQEAASIGLCLAQDSDEADVVLVDQIRSYLRREECRLLRRFPSLRPALDRLWNASVALDPGSVPGQYRAEVSSH